MEGGSQAVVEPESPSPHELFGWSISGGLIGAPGADQGTGAAYLFRREADAWTQTARFQPSSLNPGDDFGWAVLSSEEMFVGAPRYGSGNTRPGSVYVFEFDALRWREIQEIRSPDGRPNDAFGASLARFENFLAVGAPGPASEAGKVYLFELRPSGEWTFVRSVTSESGRAEDFFGGSVHLFGDLLIAGAVGVDDGVDQQVGAAYAFELGSDFAEPFCFGDGSLAPCPCANNSLPGDREGCLLAGEGSRLYALGSNSVSRDSLTIIGTMDQPGTLILYAGRRPLDPNRALPFPFGGLMCVRREIQLGADFPGNGITVFDRDLISRGGWRPGETVLFQALIFGLSADAGCGTRTGLSSALKVTLVP